ncbi:hypothetical protein CTP10_R65100 (plasmid) [Cupriavidus sp. P-10]|nr:hypothetical protein [Cupriavidus sp. P-10]BDB29097.1 hypothetical protein CTP10_R65100 [Cupriavidus sp. P-10]
MTKLILASIAVPAAILGQPTLGRFDCRWERPMARSNKYLGTRLP